MCVCVCVRVRECVCVFRGHLQTMICTLNVIVTLRGWGGVLAVMLIISFLCNRMGMRQKTNGVLTCLLYTL